MTDFDSDQVFSDTEELLGKLPRVATPYKALFKNNAPMYTIYNP